MRHSSRRAGKPVADSPPVYFVLLANVITLMCVATGVGQTVVVDNTDPGLAALSESWPTASAEGQYGVDYRYRASQDEDWQLVAQQLDYARQHNVPHGCLWVYHRYTSQVAIQDEIDRLPEPGRPWEQPAANPFTSDRMIQLIIDNQDFLPAYTDSGNWVSSGASGYFRFDSRLTAGGVESRAEFAAAIPTAGRYDVHIWYTSGPDRNDTTQYAVMHHLGTSQIQVDQCSGGGQWVPIGQWIFQAGPIATRVTVSNVGSETAEYTSSDAVKLTLTGFAMGDVTGDGHVDVADYVGSAGCVTGPESLRAEGACEAFDFDDDLDVDLTDLARLQQVFGT